MGLCLGSVWSLGFGGMDLEFRVEGSGFRIWGSGFMVQGVGSTQGAAR